MKAGAVMRYIAPTAEVREGFHHGRNRKAYEMLGAHPVEQDGKPYWHFAVWAPNAKKVSLIGEFCQWDKTVCPMVKQYDGIWEVRLPAEKFSVESDPKRYQYADAAEKLRTYKYAIQGIDGAWHEKADPYGFQMQLRPNTASMLCDLSGYAWQDHAWMKQRAAWDAYHSPMNIYEVHLGSWKRAGSGKTGTGGAGSETGEAGEMLTYAELAEQLIPYVQDMGYTHIELLPVMEHPLDMSWGYQVTGYYAATSRYGTPKELMAFIDRCHQANIGVILDWVPAHFPRDEIGLRQFDGTACYEHPDPRRGEMAQWGTCMFDFARGEACSFLLSNACFWLEWYHADGLRVDAVSAMLYHDFCREPGQWLPNKNGGRENLDAIAFLQNMNTVIYHDFPGAMTIAEESTAFPMVTKPASVGGLGFGFKWNMGWMNDMLSYIKLDPIYRKWHHDKLTFSLYYAFSENYILPFSHDEVVHGKHSMLDKQPGDIWKKFAGLRALYGYTIAHPGKKLLFMGSEFGQFIEWKFSDQLDWFLLMYDRHPQLQDCVRTMNRLYKSTPALYQVDDSWDGFQWITVNDCDNSVVAFLRTDKSGNAVLCVTNFTPTFHPVYRVGLPHNGTLTEIFNTDRKEFGGSNQYNAWPCKAEVTPWNGLPFSTEICVPPLSTVFFRYDKLPDPLPAKVSLPDAVQASRPAVSPAPGTSSIGKSAE
jgi:1,4-alpha-glucan branching enzyme